MWRQTLFFWHVPYGQLPRVALQMERTNSSYSLSFSCTLGKFYSFCQFSHFAFMHIQSIGRWRPLLAAEIKRLVYVLFGELYYISSRHGFLWFSARVLVAEQQVRSSLRVTLLVVAGHSLSEFQECEYLQGYCKK